jgi:hypothetical protein
LSFRAIAALKVFQKEANVCGSVDVCAEAIEMLRASKTMVASWRFKFIGYSFFKVEGWFTELKRCSNVPIAIRMMPGFDRGTYSPVSCGSWKKPMMKKIGATVIKIDPSN